MGYSPLGHKELDTTEQLSLHVLFERFKVKYFLFSPKERGQDLNLIWDKKEIQDESLQPSHEYSQFLLKSSPVIGKQVYEGGTRESFWVFWTLIAS